MKKKLQTLALTLIALASITGLSIGQQKKKQPRFPTSVVVTTTGETMIKGASVQIEPNTEAFAEKAVAEAMASSVVTVNGKEFPSVAKGAGSDDPFTGGASCELGDTQAFTQNAAIDLESPKHVKKSNTYPSSPPERKIVSPPNADWVIQSYVRVVTSAGAPYEAGDSAFPAGYSFLTSGNYSSVKTTMHSYVGSLNVSGKVKADLNAKLDTLISNVSSYSYSLGGSHGTVEHTALVRGTGNTNTTAAHSWYHAYINGTLVCAPAYLHDQNALTTRLKAWVSSTSFTRRSAARVLARMRRRPEPSAAYATTRPELEPMSMTATASVLATGLIAGV